MALFLRFRFQKAMNNSGKAVGTGMKVAEMDIGLLETNAYYIYYVPWYCAKPLYMYKSFNFLTTPLGWCYIILIL